MRARGAACVSSAFFWLGSLSKAASMHVMPIHHVMAEQSRRGTDRRHVGVGRGAAGAKPHQPQSRAAAQRQAPQRSVAEGNFQGGRSYRWWEQEFGERCAFFPSPVTYYASTSARLRSSVRFASQRPLNSLFGAPVEANRNTYQLFLPAR